MAVFLLEGRVKVAVGRATECVMIVSMNKAIVVNVQR